jgi:hypothetical protein
MPALMSLLPLSSKIVDRILPFHSFLKSIRYYPLDEESIPRTSSLVTAADYKRWIANYEAARDTGDSVIMRLLHMAITNHASFDELQSLMGPNGLGLIDSILLRTLERGVRDIDEGDPKREVYWLQFKPCGERTSRGNYFDYSELSLGTRRVLRTLVSLLMDGSSVLLIEHPEDGIHRGLLRKVVDVFRSYSSTNQIILSSHSSVVFDALQPDEVRLIAMSDGSTTAQALSEKESRLAISFLDDEGTLSEFLDSIEEH